MNAPDKSGFRAYLLDKNDHIVKSYELEAENTSAALETARQWVDGHDVEVWQRTHIIGRLKRVE